MIIEFSVHEMCMAMALVASYVQMVFDRNLPVTDGAPRCGIFQRQIIGTLAEMAVAKWLRVYYEPGTLKTMRWGDVCGIEVRGYQFDPVREARGLEQYKLRVNKSDKPERRVISVEVREPYAELKGWIVARDAQRADWWENPQRLPNRGGFMVPHKFRLPMSKW